MPELQVSTTFSDGEIISAANFNTNYSDIVTYINNRNSSSSSWDSFYVTHATNVPIVANNSTGTQDIARFQDNGTNVFQIVNGGILNMLGQPTISSYNSAAEAITSAEEIVPLNTERFDVSSEFNSLTYRYTATQPGKYLFILSGSANRDFTGAYTPNMILKKNGSTVSQTVSFQTGNVSRNPDGSFIHCDLVSLVAGDYIEFYSLSTTGFALRTEPSGLAAVKLS